MSDNRIKSLVIVGGGTAGWMAAAALAKKFGSNNYTEITLIESNKIDTIGVGEATVPAIREFLKFLQIDEKDFVKKTNATFKLAIGFEGWAGANTNFFHPFAEHGVSIAGIGFLDIWTKLKQQGLADDIDEYCLASHLAKASKFALPRQGSENPTLFNHAFHFDAKLVAVYLRRWAENHGVKRKENTIVKVKKDSKTGNVESLEFENGDIFEGDLFIDCSGFKALLIEEALETGFEDWSHWLLCDRAVVMATESSEYPESYTLSTAHSAGWQWRIPLQNRVGNGFIYSSEFIKEDIASRIFLATLDKPLNKDLYSVRFQAGVRKKIWHKNVFCLGLAAGFLEPLESTSIYLIQSGIFSLLNNFPGRVPNKLLQQELNDRNYDHWSHIRDFIILHYALNKRNGEPFWDCCRTMELPRSLVDTITLYRETGRIQKRFTEFFQKSSWVSLFSGFGIVPEYYHPSVDDFEETALVTEFESLVSGIKNAVKNTASHKDFIEKNCKA